MESMRVEIVSSWRYNFWVVGDNGRDINIDIKRKNNSSFIGMNLMIKILRDGICDG